MVSRKGECKGFGFMDKVIIRGKAVEDIVVVILPIVCAGFPITVFSIALLVIEDEETRLYVFCFVRVVSGILIPGLHTELSKELGLVTGDKVCL